MSCFDPVISLVASAIRTELWERFLDSLKSNDTTYEVVFVGNKKPNFRDERLVFIYSEVKPSQCYEIGFRIARGEYVHWTADDVIYEKRALDYATENYFKKDLIKAFYCIENGHHTSEGHTIFEKGSQRMAPLGMMKREYLYSLGGYDKNFICGQAENDLVMRAIEKGAEVKIEPYAKVYIDHEKVHKGISKFRVEDGYNYHLHDRKIIERCWSIDGKPSKTRLFPFEPYNIREILYKTQGIRGEWR